jgi:hypothetical protein
VTARGKELVVVVWVIAAWAIYVWLNRDGIAEVVARVVRWLSP